MGELDPLTQSGGSVEAIGAYAQWLIDRKSLELPPEHRWQTPWHDLSEHARSAYAGEDCLVALLGSPPPTISELVSGGDPAKAQTVVEALATFHDTLPLNRGERLWLAQTLREAKTPDLGYDMAAADMMQLRGPVRALGKRQIVTGEELFARMWDWRRQLGEYDIGTGLMLESAVALQGVAAACAGPET